MNDTLLDQCRREAEERYPMPVFESGNYVHTTDVALAHAVVSARQESHAAALYAERSKRPPAVEGPSMITVEEAIAVLKPWIAKNSEDGEVLWHVLPEEKAEGITKYEADLRERLTAAATNNTNDNEAR